MEVGRACAGHVVGQKVVRYRMREPGGMISCYIKLECAVCPAAGAAGAAGALNGAGTRINGICSTGD